MAFGGADADQSHVVSRWRDARHRDRHPGRHRPGAHHRAPAALRLLSSAIPLATFVIFGSIYYGAMYSSSTTSILHQDAGRDRLDGHRHRRPPWRCAAAPPPRWRRPPSAPLSPARSARSHGAHRSAVGEAGAAVWLCRLFRAHVRHLRAVSSLLGSWWCAVCRPVHRPDLGFVGIDQLTGNTRFAFGSPELYDGIGLVVVVVGLFAVGEALHLASRSRRATTRRSAAQRPALDDGEEWARSWKPWLRGAFIGFPLGALPAGGTELPTFISYQVEKKLSANPDEFGRAPSRASPDRKPPTTRRWPASSCRSLTLGLPTSATAADHACRVPAVQHPARPLLFQSQPDLVWGLIASLFIGNVMLLSSTCRSPGCGRGCSHSAALALWRHPRVRACSASMASAARCSTSACSP